VGFLAIGIALLALIIGLFWLKDRLRSPLLARIVYSEPVARLAVVGAALSLIGILMLLAGIIDGSRAAG
jgi:hypothetical protein